MSEATGAYVPLDFEKIEYLWPDRYTVGKTGEHEESRIVTVQEYAWECAKCSARGIDYEDERTALDAAVRHQAAQHSTVARGEQEASS